MAMEGERVHRGSSELFVCFTSRPCSSSSSSMKISSKSILSPGRTDKFRETATSRRLKSNGSIKGQSSPMFPTGRRKGCGFDTQEPSSPKVTCIGQVRVKTKQGKRRKAKATSGAGETSFRGSGSKREQDCLPHRNQRWGHLFGFRKEVSFSICEAIRTFGAELNCFLPCGGGSGGGGCGTSSSNASGGVGGGGGSGSVVAGTAKGEKETSNACGAVFAKWLMVLQESDQKRLQEEEREETQCGMADQRVVVEMERVKVEAQERVKEIEEETVIAAPPRNALLLMRSRSEPFRTSSLANRFWDSPAPKDDDDNDDGDDDDDEEEESDDQEEEEEETGQGLKEVQCADQGVIVPELGTEHQTEGVEEIKAEQERKEQEEEEKEVGLEQEGSEHLLEIEENETHFSDREDQREEITGSPARCVQLQESLDLEEEEEGEEEEEECVENAEKEKGKENEENVKETEERTAIEASKTEPVAAIKENEEAAEGELQRKKGHQEEEEGEDYRVPLPDCLLLMMCEPKLSMEVSKETWVCSSDFLRRHPEKEGTKGSEDCKKRVNTEEQLALAAAAALPAPPPAPPASMGTMLEQKLVHAYEPFILTRCKSEPLRSSAKLSPEACFWKSRKLDQPFLGVGSAGMGF